MMLEITVILVILIIVSHVDVSNPRESSKCDATSNMPP
jgi:hypothetical protein